LTRRGGAPEILGLGTTEFSVDQFLKRKEVINDNGKRSKVLSRVLIVNERRIKK